MPYEKGETFEIAGVKFNLASRKQLAPLNVPQYDITPTPAELADPGQLLVVPLDDYRDGSGHSFAVVPTGYDMGRGLVAVNGNELRTWGRGRQRTFSMTGVVANARFFVSNTKLWVIGGNTALRFLVDDVVSGVEDIVDVVAEETHMFPAGHIARGAGVRFGDKMFVALVNASDEPQRFAVLDLNDHSWTSGPAGVTAHVLFNDGQRLWRGSGNKIAACLTDPTDADAWGTEYQVGDESYNISAIGQWDRVLAVGRPDGFWNFDERFIARRANLGVEYALTEDSFEGMRDFWGYLYAPSPLGLVRWRPGVVEYVGPEAQGTLDSGLSAGLGEVRAMINYGPWIFLYGTAGSFGAILTMLTGTAGQASVVEQLDREQDRRAQHLEVIPAVGRRVSVSDQPVRAPGRDFNPSGTEAVKNAQVVQDRDLMYLLRGETVEGWDISLTHHLSRAGTRDLDVGAGRTGMFAHENDLWVTRRYHADHYVVGNAGSPNAGNRDFALPSLQRTIALPDGGYYVTSYVNRSASISVSSGSYFGVYESDDGVVTVDTASAAEAAAGSAAAASFAAAVAGYSNVISVSGPSISYSYDVTLTINEGPGGVYRVEGNTSATASGSVTYEEAVQTFVHVPGGTTIVDYDYVAAAVHDDHVWLFDTRETTATCFDLSGNNEVRDEDREFDAGEHVDAAAVLGDTLYLVAGTSVSAWLVGSTGPPQRVNTSLVLASSPTGAAAFGRTIWFMEISGLAYTVPLPAERRVAAPYLVTLSSDDPAAGAASTAFRLIAREMPIAALSPGEGNSNREAADVDWLSPRTTAPHITIPKAYEGVEFDLDFEGGAEFEPRVELRCPGYSTELDRVLGEAPTETTGTVRSLSHRYRVVEGLPPQPWGQVHIFWSGAQRATIRGLRLRAWQRPRTTRSLVVRANLLRDSVRNRRTPFGLQKFLEDLSSENHGVEPFVDPRGDRYDVVVTGVRFQHLKAQDAEQPEWLATIEMREADVARVASS